MDFCKKSMDNGMVDNPLEKKVEFLVLYLPSSLHGKELKAPTVSISDVRLM